MNGISSLVRWCEVKEGKRIPSSLSTTPHSTLLNASIMTTLSLDPSSLFNSSLLSILIPESSISAPPRSLFSSSSRSTPPHPTREWIHSLLRSKQRTTIYQSELIEFYLVLSLLHPISSSQAHSFLLKSLDEPHLTLTTTISYIEGDSQPRPNEQQNKVSALSTSSSKFPITQNTTSESIHVATQSFDQESGQVWVGKGLNQEEEEEWVGIWKFTCSISEPYSHAS